MKQVARMLFVGAMFLASLAAVPSVARAEITDKQLIDKVAETVERYAQFSIFDDVNVGVENRVVHLTGRVTTQTKRDEIGKRVAKIDGVRSLVNDIQVLPLSPADAQLRVAIANAIYNHPAFWRYSSMSVPPIHIIVENGHVTLTGSVENQLDRSLAYAVAQVPGAISVRNDLRVER